MTESPCRRMGHDWSGQPFYLNGNLAWKCQRLDCDRIRICDERMRMHYMFDTPDETPTQVIALVMTDDEIRYTVDNALCEISCDCCSCLVMAEDEIHGMCMTCYEFCDPDDGPCG